MNTRFIIPKFYQILGFQYASMGLKISKPFSLIEDIYYVIGIKYYGESAAILM